VCVCIYNGTRKWRIYFPQNFDSLYISKAEIVSLRELQLINFQLIMSLEMLDRRGE
jgi:hypothetical protein